MNIPGGGGLPTAPGVGALSRRTAPVSSAAVPHGWESRVQACAGSGAQHASQGRVEPAAGGTQDPGITGRENLTAHLAAGSVWVLRAGRRVLGALGSCCGISVAQPSAGSSPQLRKHKERRMHGGSGPQGLAGSEDGISDLPPPFGLARQPAATWQPLCQPLLTRGQAPRCQP